MDVKKSYIAIALCAPIAIVVLAVLVPHIPKSNMKTVAIDGTTLSVEVADTPLTRERGLSGRKLSSSMLFVFKEEWEWGIWMKDMYFPIDIIWVGKEGIIVTIKENATPETYPEVFYPKEPALYILEVPGGFVDTHGLAEGMKVVL